MIIYRGPFTMPINNTRSAFGGLEIRLHPHQHPIDFQGRAAQVLSELLRHPDKPSTVSELVQVLVPSPNTLEQGERAVYNAVTKIKTRCPKLLYQAGRGRGWRIASDAKVHVVWDRQSPPAIDRKTAPSGSPLVRGDWSLSPEEVRWRGILLPLTPRQRLILHHLARRFPDRVQSSELNEATQLDGRWETTGNQIALHITALKKRLAECNVPLPWSSTVGRGGGYRWVVE